MIALEGNISKVEILLIIMNRSLALAGKVTESKGKNDIIYNGLIMLNKKLSEVELEIINE